MQNILKFAIAITGLILLALLGRRLLLAASRSDLAVRAEPFAYARIDRSVASIGPDLRSMGGLLDVPRDRHGHACEGDRDALAAIAARARDAVAQGEDPDAIRSAMSSLVVQCFDPAVDTGLCRWAANEIDAGGDLAFAGWSMLVVCPASVAGAYFDRLDAPAEDVLAFASARTVGVASLAPDARLPSQYARAVIERAAIGASTMPAVAVIYGPARYEDPAATEALLAAYETAPDALRRHAIGRSLALLSDPRARAASRATCLEEQAAMPELCAADGSALGALRLLQPPSYAAQHPAQRASLLAELEPCARGEREDLPFAAICLRGLAELDWDRARAIASDASPSLHLPGALGRADDPARAAFVSVLTRYPSADALVLTLRSRGLLGAPRPTSRPPVTLAQTMVAYGRGWSIEGVSPLGAGHDRLARHLARLATPALDDVTFDEVLPDASELVPLPIEIELVAYARSERWATIATSDDDYYDLSATAGLLNALLRERGSDLRYLVVDDPFAEEIVVVGTADALSSAIADDLLVPVTADALGL
jgi:hypothetical protein